MPAYYTSRIMYATRMINHYSHDDSSLVDIGCGTGTILEIIKKETKLKNLCGIDVSQNSLLKTEERVGCETLLGSVLDNDFVERVPGKFDFAVLAAVLHHLIGKTRKESRNFAALAVLNSLKMLKDGGYLIVSEPTFYPSFPMTILFYIKKLVTTVTSKRVQILNAANNIGAPVVSYFTIDQLIEIFKHSSLCQIVNTDIEESKLSLLMRLAFITQRSDTTVITRKT